MSWERRLTVGTTALLTGVGIVAVASEFTVDESVTKDEVALVVEF
jgi:hypothetical protein